MEEFRFSNPWNYEMNIKELRQKLESTTSELKKLEMERSEERRKNEEHVSRLMQLLKNARQERDKAKDQLQKILNRNNLPTISQTETFSNLVYDFIDPVSPLELLNMKFGDWNSITSLNPPLNHDPNAIHGNRTSTIPSGAANVDNASLIIDNLAKGKDLPTKGRFFKAVSEAGSVLPNLLVRGPLPTWPNPPPQLPIFNNHPVHFVGSDPNIMNPKASGHDYNWFDRFEPNGFITLS